MRWVRHLPHADRIAPGLAVGVDVGQRGKPVVLPRRWTIPGVLTIEVFGKEDLAHVATAARDLGFKVLNSDKRARLLTLETDDSAIDTKATVRQLSAVHGVRFIRERVLARTSNNVATGVMDNAYAAVKPSGLKLSGAPAPMTARPISIRAMARTSPVRCLATARPRRRGRR